MKGGPSDWEFCGRVSFDTGKKHRGYNELRMWIAGDKEIKGLMPEWTNFVGALHGAAAAFLVDT